MGEVERGQAIETERVTILPPGKHSVPVVGDDWCLSGPIKV